MTKKPHDKKVEYSIFLCFSFFLAFLCTFFIWNYLHQSSLYFQSSSVNNNRVIKLRNFAENDLLKVVSKVKRVQNPDTITFAFITDSHFDYNKVRKTALSHFNEVDAAAEKAGANFIVHGGDIIDGYETKEKSLKLLNKSVDELLKYKSCSILLTKGNHDDNTLYNVRKTPKSAKNVIFPEEMYNSTIEKIENDIITDKNNPYGFYYYKDFPQKKLRVVVLNTSDIPIVYKDDGSLKYNGISQYGISSKQLNWIAHDALNFASISDRADWNVIFFSHAPLYSSLNYHHSIPNGDIMVNIIESFKNGKKYSSEGTKGDFKYKVSVDFQEQGKMNVVGLISGHVHRDSVRVEQGITCVTTLNSVPIKLNGRLAQTPDRRLNSSSENAFDIFTIDTVKHKMYIFRFGAGNDRIIEY